jgi:N4-gp56 family major capsid protein
MAIYVFNSGNSTQGTQVQNFYSRIARRKVDQVFNFSKFANASEMMKTGHGKNFKVSTYFWSIHREVIDANGNYTGIQGGYITERDMAKINQSLTDMEVTTEGLTNKADIYQLGTFRKVTFETQMKKYAGIVELAEDTEKYSEDPVRQLALEDATLQMNDSYNSLMLRDILSSTFKVYGGDATSRDELGGDDDTKSREYTLTEQLSVQVMSKLVANKARPMTSIIAGQNRIGTKPIPKSFYIVVGHALYSALINKDLFPDFTSIEEYADGGKSALNMDGLEEIGRLGRFRILYAETMTNYAHQGAKVGDGSAPSEYCHSSQDPDDSNNYHYDVFPAVVMSKNAIATVGLQGNTKHMLYTRWPDVIDNGNPIGERGYIAFKFRYATVITRPDHLAVMELTCPIA